MQLKEKEILCEIPGRPWMVLRAYLFTLYNSNFPCAVDNPFPIVKGEEKLSEDSLIMCCKIIFVQYMLPKEIMSDGTNLVFR